MLHIYEAASGQAINLNKSCIYFSPNTSQEMKEFLFSSLNMQCNESFEAYLGLPAFTWRKKQRIFYGIKEKVWKKLQGWRGKLFSVGEKNSNQGSGSSYPLLHYEYLSFTPDSL